MNAENVTYFDSFGVENIQKQIRNKNMTPNIYKIHGYRSIMCGYFCFGLIDFMLKDKKSKKIMLKYINRRRRRIN